jgi:hypothetical protein
MMVEHKHYSHMNKKEKAIHMQYRARIFDEVIPLGTEDKFEIVKKYSESHPKFDMEFIESLQDLYYEFGDLTESQERALDNIIERYRMV